MANSTNLRSRLENAIRNNQTQKQAETFQRPSIPESTSSAPTIKLKTDFRNFNS